jgi:predicted CoA-binding protein
VFEDHPWTLRIVPGHGRVVRDVDPAMDDAEREALTRIYRESRTVAVVGASADSEKAASRIPEYLQRQGYRIRPVDPRGGTILGEPVAVRLADVDEPVDVVDVFCPAAEAVDIARQAVDIGAEVLWPQLGIVSEEAREVAGKAGLTVVVDRCMGAAHRTLGLGPMTPTTTS